MPVKRQPNKRQISRSSDSIDKEVEKFASSAEIHQKTAFDKNALPTIGMTIKFNQYEHGLLRNMAKAKGRSMQQQIRRILIKELEKYV